MSDTKFTPGPWDVVDGDEICSGRVLVAGTFEPESYVLPAAKKMALPTMAECRANACLIACAPEMYSILEAVAYMMDARDEAQERAGRDICRILSKARGE